MRKKIFIDCETTGLIYGEHSVIEIAYMHEDWDKPKVLIPYTYIPGEEDTWRPPWAKADPVAMEINKFYERYPEGVRASTNVDFREFIETVRDNTLVGANVRFDARFIHQELASDLEPWHHRLIDLQVYAAGVFGWLELRGWSDIVAYIKEIQSYYDEDWRINLPMVETKPDHSAYSDCLSVAEVYRWLRWWRAEGIEDYPDSPGIHEK